MALGFTCFVALISVLVLKGCYLFGGVIFLGVLSFWGCYLFGGVIFLGVLSFWGVIFLGSYLFGGVIFLGVLSFWGCYLFGAVIFLGCNLFGGFCSCYLKISVNLIFLMQIFIIKSVYFYNSSMNAFRSCMIKRVLLMLFNYDSHGVGGGAVGAPYRLVSYYLRSSSYKKTHFDKILLVIFHKETCILLFLSILVPE